MGKQLNVENSVISAKDDALFYNAMLQKNGVWQYGNKLDYEIISANQINIKDGMVTAQGRNYVIYPNEVDSMTIENGTVNTKRYDLIVYEVSKTSEGEQVGLKVIKGTNATTPTDPTLTQDDTLASGSKYQMPLYRVRLNGINIEGVDDLREYIVSFGNLANDNLLINGDFQIWQRGEDIDTESSSINYTADRWENAYSWSDVTKQTNEDTSYPFLQYLRCACKGAYEVKIRQRLENAIYNQKGFTVSFWCRSYNVDSLQMSCGGVDFTITSTWQKYELFLDLDVISNLSISMSSSNTNLISEVAFDIAFIKLEQGSIATPFVPRPYGEELALCQRYYRKTSLFYYYFFTDNNGTGFSTSIQCPMRVKPSITLDSVPTIMRSSASTGVTTTIALGSSNYSRDLLTMHFTSSANLGGRVPVWAYENFNISLDAEIY